MPKQNLSSICIQASLGMSVVLLIALVTYFQSISLVAFQKSAMIVPVDTLRGFTAYRANRGESLPDVRNLLAQIPYQDGQAIYDILPKDRFRQTIQMGYGNCSNLVFGMAFNLLLSGSTFQVVHFMPYQGFLTGTGHTVINMPYLLDGVRRVGIVDVLEGGVPQEGEKFVDLPMLQSRQLSDSKILPFNSRKDNQSNYYGDFLDQSALGIVPAEEIERYFDFIERIYVPLGHKRFERVIYSGIAIVFGRYPHTYVIRDEYKHLFANQSYLPRLAQLLIWLVRLIPFVLLSAIVFYFLAEKRAKGSDSESILVEG